MKVDSTKCIGCGLCVESCGTRVLKMNKDTRLPYLAYAYCSNCGHCLAICPKNAITLEKFPNFEAIPVNSPNLTFNQLLSFVQQRRSYRQFKDKPISNELLEKILSSVNTIPTGCNAQELEITILTKKTQISRIAEAMHKKFKIAAWLTNYFPIKQFMLWTKSKEDAARNIVGPQRLIEEFELGNDLYLRNAPVVIIIHTAKKMEMRHLDAGIAGYYLNLACETEGLGCCWIGFHSELCKYFPKIRRLSAIPKKHKILATMVVGYPKVQYLRTCPRFEIPLHFH